MIARCRSAAGRRRRACRGRRPGTRVADSRDHLANRVVHEFWLLLVDVVPDPLGDDVAAVRHEVRDLCVQLAEDPLLLRQWPTWRTFGGIVRATVGEDD